MIGEASDKGHLSIDVREQPWRCLEDGHSRQRKQFMQKPRSSSTAGVLEEELRGPELLKRTGGKEWNEVRATAWS